MKTRAVGSDHGHLRAAIHAAVPEGGLQFAVGECVECAEAEENGIALRRPIGSFDSRSALGWPSIGRCQGQASNRTFRSSLR